MNTGFLKTRGAALFLSLFWLAACTSTAALGTETAPAAVDPQPVQVVSLSPQAPTPDLTAALAPFDAQPQRAALVQFILEDLAGTERQHLLVAQVRPDPKDARGKLNLRVENILRAWIYQDGRLSDCPPAYFAQSYTQEPDGPWKYAYMAFSINKVDPDFKAAALRIDRIPGSAGGRGETLELVRAGEQWGVKSQRVTWIQ